jgi:hypothetical protein
MSPRLGAWGQWWAKTLATGALISENQIVSPNELVAPRSLSYACLSIVPMGKKFDTAVEVATVKVMVGPYFLEPPTSIYEVRLGQADTWNLHDVLEDLEELATLDGALSNGHKLDVHVGHTSWGFDASQVEIVMYLGQHLANEVFRVSVEIGVLAVLRRIASPSRDREARPVGRLSAQRSALLRVATAYEEETEAALLSVVGEDEMADHAGWRLHVHSIKTNRRYTVTVTGPIGSSAHVTRVSRHPADGSTHGEVEP